MAYAHPHDSVAELRDAHAKAEQLCYEVEARGFIKGGQLESELSKRVYKLAKEMFGVWRHWHKRVVRAGRNTLFPYQESPPDRLIEEDDILFIDLGPVFESWEADIGRTFVVGEDPRKLALKTAVEVAWYEGQSHFLNHMDSITGAGLYAFSVQLAHRMGYEYGGPHCGHLIGRFPHEVMQGDFVSNYLHPQNHQRLALPDRAGRSRHWVYEVHFVDSARGIGGFFEQFVDSQPSSSRTTN